MGLNSIGPAFADEIFRVFTQQHPNLVLRYANANKEVRKMIMRAQSQQ
ncbi:MAG: STAS-like domain-containing protein [bacterium]